MSAIEGRSNKCVMKSKRLFVYDVNDFLFFLKNGTYSIIIKPSKTKAGHMWFTPFVYDRLSRMELSIVRVYERGETWTRESAEEGEVPDFEYGIRPEGADRHAAWVEVFAMICEEMERMQVNLIGHSPVSRVIHQGSEIIKPSKVSQVAEANDKHFNPETMCRAAVIQQVYLFQPVVEAGKKVADDVVCGVSLQATFPVDLAYSKKSSKKRRLDTAVAEVPSEEGEEKA